MSPTLKPIRPEPSSRLRHRLFQIIFETDTRAGKRFDVALIVIILISVLAVVLESVASLRGQFGRELRYLEWALTVLFTIEYLLRLLCVKRPASYALSFFGLVDLLAVLPTYLGLFFGGTHSLVVIRALRLLRVFRVLRLSEFVSEARSLVTALRSSGRKITIFVGTVLTIQVIIGALMYLIEGPEHGFTSIPQGIYWAIVTMTTVGFGDLVPQTAAGKMLASAVMIMGYGIIAVPTGIVTVEMTLQRRTDAAGGLDRVCEACSAEGHDRDAKYCNHCGAAFEEDGLAGGA